MMLLEIDPEVARPGWVPLVILIVMVGVLVVLYRSMRAQFSRIDPALPHEADLQATAEGPDRQPAEQDQVPIPRTGSPGSPGLR